MLFGNCLQLVFSDSSSTVKDFPFSRLLCNEMLLKMRLKFAFIHGVTTGSNPSLLLCANSVAYSPILLPRRPPSKMVILYPGHTGCSAVQKWSQIPVTSHGNYIATTRYFYSCDYFNGINVTENWFPVASFVVFAKVLWGSKFLLSWRNIVLL